MQTASYEKIAQHLDQALSLCVTLGLGDIVAASRFKAYQGHIERLIEAVAITFANNQGRGTAVGVRFPEN